MYKEILTKKQIELLPLVETFKREFHLVGGTAIALHIGHRRSVDFDLFKYGKLRKKQIADKIEKNGFSFQPLYQSDEELTIVVNSVKMTFYSYPYQILHPLHFDKIISLPDLLDLAAMKAFALGKRAKWKDYADLYFILKNHYGLRQISDRSSEIFGKLFSEKLFRQQLCFFNDINYSEKVEFVSDEVSDEEIRIFLTDIATTHF